MGAGGGGAKEPKNYNIVRFSSTWAHSLALLTHLGEVVRHGRPLLLCGVGNGVEGCFYQIHLGFDLLYELLPFFFADFSLLRRASQTI